MLKSAQLAYHIHLRNVGRYMSDWLWWRGVLINLFQSATDYPSLWKLPSANGVVIVPHDYSFGSSGLGCQCVTESGCSIAGTEKKIPFML